MSCAGRTPLHIAKRAAFNVAGRYSHFWGCPAGKAAAYCQISLECLLADNLGPRKQNEESAVGVINVKLRQTSMWDVSVTPADV